MRDDHLYYRDDVHPIPIREMTDAEIADVLRDGAVPLCGMQPEAVPAVVERLQIEQTIRRLNL